MKALKVLGLAVVIAFGLYGCSYEDADESKPAISALSVEVDDADIARHEVKLAGEIHLSYVSDKLVVLRVLDNDSEVVSETYGAADLVIPYEITVPVVHEGKNVLTVEAEYNGEKVRKVVEVDKPGAIQSFELVPDASEVQEYRVHVTGSAEFGWYSETPAVLSVSVNGKEVYAETVWVKTGDASEAGTLRKEFSFDLPLSSVGSNDVVGVLRYGGHEAKVRFEVRVPGSIEDLTATAPNEVQELWATVEGNVVFGHRSESKALLSVDVGGRRVYEENLDVSTDLEQAYSVRIPLNEGNNEVVVRVSYDGEEAVRYLNVKVPEAIESLEARAATQVQRLEVVVDGTMVFGYVSDERARLEISVDDQVVYQKDVSVDATLVQHFQAVVPLSEGDNKVVVKLTYRGSEAVQQLGVAVPRAIESLDAEAPAQVHELEASVDGTVVFGYVSDSPARLEVLVDGEVAHAEDLPVDATLVQHFHVTVPLGGDGIHVLTTRVNYAGMERVVSRSVYVPLAVQSIDLHVDTPVQNYSTVVRANVHFGYVSDEPAIVNIYVNGQLVSTESVTVDMSLQYLVYHPVPLSADANDIVLEVLYGGRTMRSHGFAYLEGTILDSIYIRGTVFGDVDYDETDGIVGYIVGDSIQIYYPRSTDYDTFEVTKVEYSWDRGETWHDITDSFERVDMGNRILYECNESEIKMRHMDTGTHEVLLRVSGLVSGREFTKVQRLDGEVRAEPKADCDVPSSFMYPTTDLFDDTEVNTRTIKAWLGLPGRHVVEISISEGGVDSHEGMGEIVSYTDSGLVVNFHVYGWASSSGNSYDNYDLAVYVDGRLVCSERDFGRIIND